MKLKELMKAAGITGAGGAGFPSYAKLSEGADTLVVNGAECEPLLYTDYYILKTSLTNVLAGISAVMEELSLKSAVLAIKKHTAERLGYTGGEELMKGVTVKVLRDVYPIGDEISLIYESTGRLIAPGALPITKGVIVYNVETLYNVGNYILYGEPVIKKWLTVSGDIEKAYTVRVPIGAKISDLLTSLGIKIPDGDVVLDGGPSMGKIKNPDIDVITKTTKAILILPRGIAATESKLTNERMAIARAETACCQCTRCTDMCPRNLLGFPLEPHKMVRTSMTAAKIMPEMVISATLCCGCGVCETLACNQGISPRAVIQSYKNLLSENKMRYTSKGDVTVAEEREYRMIPIGRWQSALGTLEFDKIPEYIGECVDFNTISIPLSQHIGAPSVAKVSVGDEVYEGNIIAESGNGLALPQHASISGKITYIDTRKIIISR